MDMMWYRRRGLMVTPHIESVTGAIASFNSDYNKIPIKSLICDIEPIQEGTGDPSPENVRPIRGRTGVNVSRTRFNQWNEEWEKGGINASTGRPANISNRIRSKNFSPCFGDAKYYVHIVFDVTIRIFWYDSERNYIKYDGGRDFAVTSPNNARYFKISVENNTYGETYRHDICVNLSDPTKNGTYEPYKGSTYSVNWETEAGTVYGGYVDVVSGKLVMDKAIDIVDGARIQVNGTLPYGALQILYYPLNQKAYGTETETNKGLISNLFRSTMAGGECTVNGGAVNRNIYFNMPSVVTNITLAQQWFVDNPTQISYELATPTEIQLTPQEVKTILDENNIWCDSGNVSVNYWKWGK